MSFKNIEEHNPEEIVKNIEEITLENYSIFEINDAFMNALKKYEERGNIGELEKIAKEIKLGYAILLVFILLKVSSLKIEKKLN